MVRAGDKVSERYEVLEQLATGGMGTLWRARHVELDVDVALKVITSEVATPVLLKRFKREAQAAARLRSPNIVQVQDYGVFEGQPYLAMELLHGEDLAARLARLERLSPQAALPILEGVARAMEAAHAAGIVHRDLKPANIFLERGPAHDIVKVLDFGVAKDTARPADPISTTGASPVGSPAYMSPEQVWGEAVSPRSDLWAMGVVAFEVLSGKSPFVDESLAKVFERILRAPLPQLREHAPDLPASFDAFFERALARKPEERFDSASELVRAFREAALGKLPARRPAKSWRALVPVLFGLGVVAVAVGAVAFLPRRSAPSRAPEPQHDAKAMAAPLAAPAAAATPEAAAVPTASATARPPTNPAKRANSAATKPSAAPPATAASAATAPRIDPQFGIPLPP